MIIQRNAFRLLIKNSRLYISCLQEDYLHDEELLSGLAEKSLAFSSGLGICVLGSGVSGGRLICPLCTGSGLTPAFNLPKHWIAEVENKSYDTYSGWLRGANDCFTYRGF